MYIDFAQPIQLPPYWLHHPEVVVAHAKTEYRQDAVLSVPHACPLSIKLDSEQYWWQFPIEPIVNISAKNRIVKSNILKPDASPILCWRVKVLWSLADSELTISGLCMYAYDK